MMKLEDFLPTYPDYEPNPIYDVYGLGVGGDEKTELTDIIQQKKEFRELTLEAAEDAPARGELLRHQRFLQRFMSGHTPYNGVLLWHAVGTGKTGSAIAIAEGLKSTGFKNALVLVRSDTFIENFKHEIVHVMTKGDYIPYESMLRPLTERERVRRTNRALSVFYEFDTFNVFAKRIKSQSDIKAFCRHYDNSLIIIDEVHNLRDIKEEGDYQQIHEFLHEIQDAKVVLLSATPIKDKVEEFPDIMNLILPKDKQLVTGPDFRRQFFRDPDAPLDVLKAKKQLINPQELLDNIKGRISYLQAAASDVTVIEAGTRDDDYSPFNVVALTMKDVQQEKYIQEYQADIEAKQSLLPNSKEASLCVPPPNSKFSLKTIEKYLNQIKVDENDENDEKKADALVKAKLEALKKISVKYHYIIKRLTNPLYEKHNAFIYCTSVTGSGIKALEGALRAFGFQEATNLAQIETAPETQRYAVITSSTLDIEQIIRTFNKPENRHGKYIRVLIGSAAIGEGRSFLSIRDIYIVTPHWNFTDMDQAIGRGIRYKSHKFLEENEREVTIHRLIAVYKKDKMKSADVIMSQKAYEKDLLAKQIESVARKAAIDCVFNQPRNQKDDIDGSRECLYEECAYNCMVPPKDTELVDTYNLFYTEKEYQDIKQQLQNLFCKEFEYRLEEILAVQEIAKYTDIVVLRSLTAIIYRREPFINPLGFQNYIKYEEGRLYLVQDFITEDDYNAKLGQLYPQQDFSAYVDQYASDNLSLILNRIVSYIEQGDDDKATILFSVLSPTIQSELLRQAIYEIYINRIDHPLYAFIEETFADSILDSQLDNGDETKQIVDRDEQLNLRTGEWVAVIRKQKADSKEDAFDLDEFKAILEKNKQLYSMDKYLIMDDSDPNKAKISSLEEIPSAKNKGVVLMTAPAYQKKGDGYKLWDFYVQLAGITKSAVSLTKEKASKIAIVKEIVSFMNSLGLIIDGPTQERLKAKFKSA